MTGSSLRARLQRLERDYAMGHSSPTVLAAVLQFLRSGKLTGLESTLVDMVVDGAKFALLGFDELGSDITVESLALAQERGASRYFMSEHVDLPEHIADRLEAVYQIEADRRGPVDPAALAYL